jgi:hypothetical protein
VLTPSHLICPVRFLRLSLGLSTRYAIMMPKGFRLSSTHLVFYVSAFIIATQLWSLWRQSGKSGWVVPHEPPNFIFDADKHANVHTFSHEQCDSSFPKLYHSLEQSVARRQGKKVQVQDIAIAKGRCMLRLLIHGGEVCQGQDQRSLSALTVQAIRCRLRQARRVLRNQRKRT